MVDIELASRRGLLAQTYNELPQQERSTSSTVSPSHDPGPNIRSDRKSFYRQSISQTESIQSTGSPTEPRRLPPLAYLQSSRKQRVWKYIFNAFAFIVGLGLPLAILMPALATANDNFETTSTFCTSVEGEDQGASISSSFSAILNVSVAYGTLSFGTAKLVDLVWDVFVSRGGQIGLGYIAYRVHNAALLRIMEDRLVSFDLYANMTLSWANIWGLRPIIKALFTKLGFKRKLLLLWVAVSIIWVAIWPTITNAMTGYVAKNNTLVKLTDGSGYANYSDIASKDSLAFQYSYSTFNQQTESETLIWQGPLLTNSGPNITLWAELVHVYEGYSTPISVIFNTSLPDSVSPTYNTTYNDYSTPAQVFYYFRNETYTYEYFQSAENVQCVATSAYQWGFSTSVLLVFIVLNTCWVVGTYGVWTHMNRKSQFCQKRRTLGKYRAAVDMVEAVHNSLGRDICAYSDAEIEQQLRRSPGIKYVVMERTENAAPYHIGLSSVEDGEKFKLNFGELYGRIE